MAAGAKSQGLESSSAIRTMLLGVFAGAALAPCAVFASPSEQALPPLPVYGAAPPPTRLPAADEGLEGAGFYMEADEIIDAEQVHMVTARGGVEARYQGRVLRADEVDYDTQTGIATAKGNVTIINADGTSEFAQNAVLDRQMSTGVASAFFGRLQDNYTVGAASVVRRSPTLTDLNEAVFTPCAVCAKKPNPTWSIRARKVTQDKKRQIITFRDAVIQVRGVPIMYVPVLVAPAPELKRKSGLLTPQVATGSIRGFSWEQPYLQIISPSQDLIISPQINSKVNPFLNFAWRDEVYSGGIAARAGYTYDRNFNSEGEKSGSAESRGYILSKGLFALTNNWDAGFTAEWTSDPLIFDKYSVSQPFVDRGLYSADDRRLISQLYSVYQSRDLYVSVAAIEVQGLRSTDVQTQIPGIAPLIEARYNPDIDILGGRLSIVGDGVMIWRQNSPVTVDLPGVDSQRGTVEAEWQATWFLPGGVRVDPFLDWRGDLYGLQKLAAPYAPNAVIFRNLPTAGVTASWPFVKQSGMLTYVLQPIVQVAVAPFLAQDPRIPIEDSIDFQFDETNLFQVDKSPGFDLLDSGQRVNLAGEATVETAQGYSAGLLIGREFRAETEPYIPARTGLQGTSSDWIVAANAHPLSGVTFFTRMRFGAEDFSLNYFETGADISTSRFMAQVRYLQEAQDPNGDFVQDLDFHGEVYVFRHWGVTFSAAKEFQTGVWRQEDFGIVYKDDCIRVDVLYNRNNTTNGVLGPSQGVSFRLSLATFGNSVYSNPEGISPVR